MPTNQDLGAVQSIAPGERNNTIKIRTLGGNRDYKTVVQGKFEINGSMEYYLQGGSFLRMAFGEDTATTTTIDSGPKIPASNTYLHVMGSANSPSGNSFPSFTLEFSDYEDAGDTNNANLKRTYSGCRVNTLSLSGNVDDPVRCSVDWMARNVSVSTADKTSITEYATDPFIFYDGFLFLTSGNVVSNTTQASIKDYALCQVLSFDFTVNNNCEAGWYIAGTCGVNESVRGAKYIIPKGRDYELRLGMHYSTKEMYERFLGAVGATSPAKTPSKFQIVIDLAKTGTPGTISASDHWMRLVFASATFDEDTINGAPEDIINNDVTVFTKSVKCYFVDGDSSYK